MPAEAYGPSSFEQVEATLESIYASVGATPSSLQSTIIGILQWMKEHWSEVVSVQGTISLDAASLSALETVALDDTQHATLAKETTLQQIRNLLDDETSDTVLSVLKDILVELYAKTEPGAIQSIDGTVQVTNWPNTQTVAGTVAISNYPSVQPVSDNGGSLTVDGTINIGNYPLTQQVSGTVDLGTTTLNALESVTSRIVDEVGTPFSSSNPLPVDVGGSLQIDNLTVNFEYFISTANSTSTPLGANASFVGQWEEVVNYAAITATYYTDQMSAINGAKIQFSNDGVGILYEEAGTVAGGVQGYASIAPKGRFFRVHYTNGPVAQSFIRNEIAFRFNSPTLAQTAIAAPVTDMSIASQTKAAIVARDASGVWYPVKTTSAGQLFVEGPLTDMQLRASALSVAVDNFPTTQAVNGTVGISNFPADQKVHDDYQGGEVLEDQTSNGGVVTFTFSSPVQLVVVTCTGSDGRADPFGGTPTSTRGVRCDDGIPVFLPVTTSSLKAISTSGTISVYGYRRS